MEIEVVADPESAARAAARLVAAEAREAAAARGQFAVAFSGGHTPWVMLRALADEDVPWDKVHVVQVDERVAPRATATGISRICAKACSTTLRFIPTTSMQCPSKNTISPWRLASMTTCCKGSLARRRSSTSFTLVLGRTDIRLRSCPATLSSKSLTPMSP